MFIKKHFTQSVTFLSLFRIYFVLSIELIKLHDPAQTKVAIELVKFLDDKLIQLPHNDVRSIDRGIEKTMSDNESVNNEFSKLTFFNGKKEDLDEVFVKGVPHEIPFKHDHESNTDYRPFERINKKEKPDKQQFLYFIKTNKYNKLNNAKPPQASLQEKIKNPEKLGDREKYIKSMLKNLDFEDLLRKYLLRMETEARRIPANSREGQAAEESDAPPMEEQPTKKGTWLPKYPFWNYWTYKKTIYQDECPGNQVSIGDICIWVPPH